MGGRNFLSSASFVAVLGLEAKCNQSKGLKNVASCAALGAMGRGNVMSVGNTPAMAVKDVHGAGPSLG